MTPYIAQRYRAWKLRTGHNATSIALVLAAAVVSGCIMAVFFAGLFALVTWTLPDPWAVARLAGIMTVLAAAVLRDVD